MVIFYRTCLIKYLEVCNNSVHFYGNRIIRCCSHMIICIMTPSFLTPTVLIITNHGYNFPLIFRYSANVYSIHITKGTLVTKLILCLKQPKQVPAWYNTGCQELIKAAGMNMYLKLVDMLNNVVVHIRLLVVVTTCTA